MVDALKLVDEETRFRIEALWSEAHRGRRNENGNGNGNFDETVTEALIKHDVESYVGVIGMRKTNNLPSWGISTGG